MKRRISALILLAAALLSLSSCAKNQRIEYCELGIILSKDFEPYDSSGAFNAAYSDGDTIVGITRYSFVDCMEYGLLTTWTPEKLAEEYLQMSGKVTDSAPQNAGDVPYYIYTDYDNAGNAYFYMPTFYRTPYAYFVITFITPKLRAAEGYDEFLDYISTVYILQEYV